MCGGGGEAMTNFCRGTNQLTMFFFEELASYFC